MVNRLLIVVLEFSAVGKERLYGLLLTDKTLSKGIARYLGSFSHMKDLGKISKKKAIKNFERKFLLVKKHLRLIILSRRKEVIVSKLMQITEKGEGIIIYDLNFRREVVRVPSRWKPIQENKKKLKEKRMYDTITLINILDNALRWFQRKKEKTITLDP